MLIKQFNKYNFNGDFLKGDTVGGNRCEIQQSDMIYMYAKDQF
jgi:hypothetical protein